MVLLQNDDEWVQSIYEAALWSSPKSLRRLFCLILLQNNPANPAAMWNMVNIRQYLSEDFKHRRLMVANWHIDGQFEEVDFMRALFDLNLIIRTMTNGTRSLRNIDGMEQVFPANLQEPPAINDGQPPLQTSETPQQLLSRSLANVQTMNLDQRAAFDGIINRLSINNVTIHSMFFIDAPGGTGKTYLLNTLSARLRSMNKIVVPVASSGIAAILLEGG
jgi:hypothetical protein